MDTKIIVFHLVLGVLAACAGAPPDGLESSTSTSVSVSTVSRRVTSRSFARSRHPANETATATEVVLGVEGPGTPGREEMDKPQKIKKKILASNLKNASEKVVFPMEKHEKIPVKTLANVSETVDGGKPNSSDSSEDEVAEEAYGKGENMTEAARAPQDGAKRNGPIEGRSLEDRSSEENVNVNTKEKTKNPQNTTPRSTSSYSYESLGELQKVLNNNYLNNNEGYERGAAGSDGPPPSPSAVSPLKKSGSVSRKNSLKNTIRFESDFYGPTGQTDWVPIIPDKLPVRSPPGGGQHFGTKLKPPTVEKSNKTSDRNLIVFPSDGASTREPETTTATTPRTRSSPPARIPTATERTNAATQPVRLATKFRGAVRYKPHQSNSTGEEKTSQNETVLKKKENLEIPATGASWMLATLGGSGGKPVREETTEITVVSSTNHTTKSQNAVDGGLAVPPENMKMENVTKEPQAKGPVPSEESKQNKSDLTNSLPKIVDGGQEWIPMKVEKDGEGKNDTDLVVPGAVVTGLRNESGAEEEKSSTVETTSETSEDPTTAEAIETTPEATTLPKLLLNPTTESPDVSSQRGEAAEGPVTVTSNVEVETSTLTSGDESSVAHTSESVVPTMPKLASTEPTDMETSTEVQPTTLPNFVQIYNASDGESPATFTQRTEEVEKSEAASQASVRPDPTPPAPAPTAPSEEVTRTTLPIETTNPKPNVTATTGTTPESGTSGQPTATTATTGTPAVTPPTVSPERPSTAASPGKAEDTRSETPEEGIHYKNYIPTTVDPHEEITEENVPAYLRLTVQAKDWEELCRLKEDLREAIIKMLGGKNVSADSVHFLNLNERNCREKMEEGREDGRNGTSFLPVNMFLMDRRGDFDKNLSEAFLTLWGRRGLDFELPIRKVDFVTPIVNLTELAEPPLGGSVVAAIVISCVAGICVILLGVLFVIMKRRQKRFNYGQRCTPVSLDAYSLDSVSIYNSVRRKDVRASKRSYGNAAFDDPEVPTHPMNFAGLANFSSDKEQLYEEFNIIPQVYPKVEELPAGAETKNRYANIIPLPETRVHLSPKDGDPLSYYINANYVRGLKGAEKVYIACQGPMESTVEDFWRMVWEQQCKVILMLTDLQENGIEKCADYLPPNEVTDNLRLFGDFQVTLKKRDVKEKYIISNLKLKNMEANLWREVTHLWYLGWPDQGVPSEANSLIAYLIEARSQMKIQNGATTPSPIVVHCSPGTGRTGTVIACDLCIREYEQSRMVDIPRCVFNLRRDRAGAVQTKDQYAFIYQVLNVYATKLSGGGIESI